MIHYKSPEEIASMQECGSVMKEVMRALIPQVVPGMTTLMVDQIATKEIISRGAELSFNKVDGYRWAICASVNHQIVHTPPTDYVLKDGDLLTIDIGVYLNGFHTDHAVSFIVGTKRSPSIERFLKVGRETLDRAIAQATAGNYIGDISAVMQEGIESAGYHVIKRLTGHGIGHDLHEEPYVPCFVSKPRKQTLQLKPGLVIAVEVMYAMGTEEMELEKGSEWSLVTKDGSLAAQFEHTLAITQNGTVILT